MLHNKISIHLYVCLYCCICSLDNKVLNAVYNILCMYLWRKYSHIVVTVYIICYPGNESMSFIICPVPYYNLLYNITTGNACLSNGLWRSFRRRPYISETNTYEYELEVFVRIYVPIFAYVLVSWALPGWSEPLVKDRVWCMGEVIVPNKSRQERNSVRQTPT